MIVAGYDGSPESREAIRWAATEAERRETALRIVHVPSPRLVAEADGEALMRRLQDVHAEAERLLLEAVDEVRPDHPGLRIQVMAVLGDVVPVLLREAADSDLLVIGSSGSTGSRLTADAPCPLVVVPARPTVTAVGAEGPR